MTSAMVTFTEDENEALKAFTRDHRFSSKSSAVVYMLEKWLEEHGYLDVEYYLQEADYENA